jgi:hypothetical protein
VLNGKVSGLTGSCPAIRFLLGQTTVTADATTDFRRGPCKNVRNGTSVEVTGHSTVGGAIAADVISVEAK